MDWSYFIYFAVVAVLLWGVGAWAAWKDKRTEAYVTTVAGLLRNISLWRTGRQVRFWKRRKNIRYAHQIRNWR